MNSKLYILVSKKLSKSQRAVQAVHAASGWLLENPDCTWRNKSLVLLGVDDLEEWSDKLKQEGKKYFLFREPYWKDLATALSSPYIGEEVKHLELL